MEAVEWKIKSKSRINMLVTKLALSWGNRIIGVSDSNFYLHPGFFRALYTQGR